MAICSESFAFLPAQHANSLEPARFMSGHLSTSESTLTWARISRQTRRVLVMKIYCRQSIWSCWRSCRTAGRTVSHPTAPTCASTENTAQLTAVAIISNIQLGVQGWVLSVDFFHQSTKTASTHQSAGIKKENTTDLNCLALDSCLHH